MGWGDELMAAGEAQAKANGRKIKVAILDSSGNPRWHSAWENHPLIAKPGEPYDESVTNGPGVRGYIQRLTSQAWIWKKYKPIAAKMYFSEEEKKFSESAGSGFVVIEPSLKGKKESVNRDWGWDRWQELVRLVPEVDWVQLGTEGTKALDGVQRIQTDTPRLMAAVLSKAKAFVSPEGGMHHTAAAVGVPGVVIHGHFNSAGVTGYPNMIHISTQELGCGSRITCPKCAEAMEQITPQSVATCLRLVLDRELARPYDASPDLEVPDRQP
jgi:ADP-heptose:LPS heptosyltransferase